MVDQFADTSVKIGNDEVAYLVVVLNHELADKKLGVTALGQLCVATLEFVGNLFALLGSGVLDSGLDSADSIMLEDEFLHAAGYDGEEFGNEFLALFFGDVRLSAQSLPNLFCTLDFVGEGFGGLALGSKLLLFGVRFARALA